MPMVAERAGVNHSSIYRRRGDVQTMINDLATYRLDLNRPLLATGDLRADLMAWAQQMVEHYRRKPANATMLPFRRKCSQGADTPLPVSSRTVKGTAC
jgi:AcrR family transcriptional regulator